jgi:hypothetical protein
MENSQSERLDEILRGIEFPGEDEAAIRSYLENYRLADKVAAQTTRDIRATRRSVFWGVFALLNLMLLALAGSNSYMHTHYFFQQNALQQFFYIFLGLTFLGGTVGLIFSLDTSWLDRLLHRGA